MLLPMTTFFRDTPKVYVCVKHSIDASSDRHSIFSNITPLLSDGKWVTVRGLIC